MKRLKSILQIVAIALIAVSCGKSYEPTANDWPQFKNDNYRSGKSEVAIFDGTFGEKWVYKAPQAPSPAWYGPAKEDAYALSGPLPSMRDYDLAYSPIIVDGKLYYGSSSDDAIHCIDAGTGKEEWFFVTDGPVRIAPTYWDGNLYFGSDDGYVYCINAKTGKEKWRFSPTAGKKQKLLNNGRLISFWPVRTGVLIEDGKAYFGASLLPWKESYLCAIDARSGKVKAENTYVKKLENMTFEGAMASSGDRLIQPQGRVSPVFINRETGEIDGQLPGAGGCFVLVTPDNHVVNTQTSRHLGIWETIPGKKKPEYMSFAGGKEMVVSGDTSFVLSDHAISAYNRKTKEVIWSDKTYFGHRVVLADTVLFIGATDTVYAVSVSTGKPMWKGHVEGTVYAMAIGDSSLFASTGEGKIYRFAKNGEQNISKQKASGMAFEMPDTVKMKKNPLSLASGPFAEVVGRNSVSVTFETEKPSVCTVYWHSNGYIVKEAFKDKKPVTEHKFILPVRKDFIYKYRIECSDKTTKEFEYDNFFNFTKPAVHVSQDWFKNSKVSRYVDDVLSATGKKNGVCVIFGLDSEQLPVQLAQKTGLDVIVLDESKRKIEKLRDKLVKAGVYGLRVSAYPVEDIDHTGVQSSIADLVICSDNDIDVDEVIRVTAPTGKAVYVSGDDKEKLAKIFLERTENSNYDWDTYEERVKIGGKFTVVLTRKIPEDQGTWTHQYGMGDNSSFGGEDLWGTTSSDDFEIQWMGRPGPRFQTDRTGRKPSPLAVNGKLFVQGNQRIVALNAYNGTILWSKDIPGMLRMNVNHDCSNWVADDKNIYIIVKDKLLELDQNTGRIIKEIAVPAKDRMRSDWGYIGTVDGLVLTSESPKGSHFTDYYGGYGWYDAVKGPATDKVMSTKLITFRPGSDKPVWTYSNGSSKIINPTIITYEGKVYFVESASAKLSEKSRGGPEIFNKIYLVSLNAKDGSLNWRKRIKNVPGITAYYMAAGNGRIVTLSSKDFRYYIYNYSAKDGSLQWEAEQRWYSNNHGGHLSIPAIVDNKLLVKPQYYDLKTGKKLNLVLPKAGHGCASYTLTKNSVFYRGGSITQFSLDTKKFSKWERLRPDCWISTVPALGMVLSPEGGGGCSCGNWFETSMVMAPKSRAPILIKFDGDARFKDTLTVSVEIKKGVEGDVYYTTDGSEPDKDSKKYTGPFRIFKNTDLKVAIFTVKEGRERKFVKSKYFERLRPTPVIEAENLLEGGKRNVTIKNGGETGVIHYTLDGSAPDEDSSVYEGVIKIDKRSTVKAVTVWDEDYGKFTSEVATKTIDVPELSPAVKKDVQPGLDMYYYEGLWHKLPDFSKEKVVKHKVVDGISLIEADRLNDYGLVFSGYIKVDDDGIYTFFTRSGDGSALYIDGETVVDNDGEHTSVEKSGTIALQKGLHKFRVEYFQSSQGQSLGVVWQVPTSRKRRISDEVLFH